MSPVQVLRPDDPAMFPVSYSDPAASPSPSPALGVEPCPSPSSPDVTFDIVLPLPTISPALNVEPSNSGVTLDASSVLIPSPSSSPALQVEPSSGPHVTVDTSTIIVLLGFLLFTLWTVAIYLFAPSLRQQFLEYRAKKRQAKKAKKQIQGLGFGYDGLTQAEVQELRNQEEEIAGRLPRYAPSLSAIPLLPPITMPLVQAETIQAHPKLDSESDPAPVYERGDYQGQCSNLKEAADVIRS